MTLPRPSRPSGVTIAALVLIGVQVAGRAWVGYAGFFSQDDYVFYARATEHPLTSADYLFEPYNAHLMPGAMVWVWLTTRAAPLAFGPVVTVSLLLQLAVSLLFFQLLRRLFGGRPAILVPLAVFALTTVTLPGLVWWAAALNQLPQQLATLLALLAQLRYAQTLRARDALLGVGAVAIGLAFSAKTVLAVPTVFGVTWLFLVGGPLRQSLWTTCRRYWVAWAGYLGLGAAYAVGYVALAEGPVRGGVTAAEAVELTDVVVRRSLLPGLLGGPWSWEPIGWVDALADPHPVAQAVAFVVVVAVVAGTIWRRAGAGRAWAFAGGYVVVELALLLFTRVQVTGVVAVGAEYRYLTDVGLVAALGFGLALVPVTAPVRHGTPRVLRERRRETWSLSRLPVDVRTVAVASVIGLVASSTYTLATFRDRWAANPGRDYFTQARHDLRAAGPEVVVYDGPVPTAVVWRLLWPATLPSRLLPPTGVDFETLQAGESTPRLHDIAADGQLRRSTVSGIAAVPGRVDGCGWRVDADGTTIPLDSDAFAWDWIIQLRYTTNRDGEIELTAGDTTTTVPVVTGTRTVYVAVTGEVSTIRLRTDDPSLRVCTDDLVVGLPQPVEW